MLLRFLLTGVVLLSGLSIADPTEKLVRPSDPPFLGQGKLWVDSVMKSMNADQRIGQLFMVAAYSNKGKAHQDAIAKLIQKHHIGGLIFMQGGPLRQANLTNYYQKISKTPLLIAIDGEWGLSMRLDSTMTFPRQMTLGAIRNDSLIYEMGAEIARQCKRLGIHVNFAPVVDVNNNPANPVINSRSFGENKFNVARKGIAYTKGLQDSRVLASAKHFPGHGDTDTDSHKALPLISHDRSRLDTLELFPFRELIRNGVGSVMVAHLQIPALDNENQIPTTLSAKVVNGLLKNELGFKGLVFTDALNMKGVSERFKPGVVDVKALLAGNDILLFSEDVPTAIGEIKKAIEEGEISIAEIDSRCRRILEAKYWCGLNKKQHVEVRNLYKDLNPKSAELIKRRLLEAALTVVSNKDKVLPLKKLENRSIASLIIDDDVQCTFAKTLQQYAPVKTFSVTRSQIAEQDAELMKKLSPFNTVIIGVMNPKHSMTKAGGINVDMARLVEKLSKKSTVILDIFANPYCLTNMGNADPHGLILSYEDNEHTQSLSAQLIFGGIKASGSLPVGSHKRYPAGSGLLLGEIIRLKYTLPEELGIQSERLARIDSLVYQAIRQKATPGAQLLIAKDGKVFYQKSFGYHTYDKIRAVENTDLYDIASITKIAASTLAIMRLTDEGYFNLDHPLSEYLPMLKFSNKSNITLREMLTHQAGLPAWIPFYTKTINTSTLRQRYYQPVQNDTFSLQVARNLFIRKDYPDTMLMQIAEVPLGKKDYKYSDLGYYLIKAIIEKHTGQSYDHYLSEHFYKPMGLSRLCYKPLEQFPAEEIVPTEYDRTFRKQLIHGYVHDQGAAMCGGVGGHAGLFSDASDLAVLMQMFLNKGVYGGERYLNQATIEEFTRCQSCIDDNRRGIGFDKPEMNYSKTGPTCKCVAAESFGHTGFTGTIAWADPVKNVIYIFLSNRVHPSAENKKLNELATRVQIQEAIYDILSDAGS